MRRALIAAVASVSLGLGTVGLAAPAMAAGPVPNTQFGMHIPEISLGVDPAVSYGAIRLWDSGISWGKVQQSKGNFWWTGMDQAIGNANTQNVKILYVLGSTPTWAASNKKQGTYPNKGAASMPTMAAWKTWVKSVVDRYGDSIESYQIWNEANLSTFWQGTPKQMAQLTKEAYKIIKAGDPGAQVVAASSTVRLQSAYKKFFPAYMKELKKLGWPVDVISAHTYPAGNGGPADRAAYISQVKADMAKAGVPAGRAFWDTEINYGIKGPGGTPGRSIGGAEAASFVARTYLDDLLLGVDRAYWYYWAPANNLIGITMQDGTPGAVGYQNVYSWLANAYYSCTPGAVNVCQLGDNVNPEVVAWASKSGGSYTVPANATTQCDALGSCSAVAPGSTVTIGSMPLWFGTSAKNAANQSGS